MAEQGPIKLLIGLSHFYSPETFIKGTVKNLQNLETVS